MLYEIIRVILIIAAIYFAIMLLKPVRVLLTVALGIIYIPLNAFQTAVQKWYFGMRKKDEVMYYAFTPFYWILVGITFVISVPYEFLIAKDIH
ncbi:MAG: hypothetical protein V4665_00560 [Patescibacteria group bacterium]